MNRLMVFFKIDHLPEGKMRATIHAALFVFALAVFAFAGSVGAHGQEQPEQRLYKMPEEIQAISALDAKEWLVFQVPRIDTYDRPIQEQVSCKAEIQAEFPRVLHRDPMCDTEGHAYDACEWEGRFEWRGEVEEATQAVFVLLDGIGGKVSVDFACSTPNGGDGNPFTAKMELKSVAPPREPPVVKCSSPVEHNQQMVCQPEEVQP